MYKHARLNFISRMLTSHHMCSQEMSTASLHYCELVTALGVVAIGGNFILKAFTLFEHPTVGALYLMGCLFEQVHVYKPATSKPGNSETYIIGKGFKASPSFPMQLHIVVLHSAIVHFLLLGRTHLAKQLPLTAL